MVATDARNDVGRGTEELAACRVEEVLVSRRREEASAATLLVHAQVFGPCLSLVTVSAL